MHRSARGTTSLDTLRRSISLIALVGLIVGIIAGLSAIDANHYRESGLGDLALSVFVQGLNDGFLRVIVVGLPVALLFYLLRRIAPRSFRTMVVVTLFAAALLVITRHPIYINGLSAGNGGSVWVQHLFRFFLIILLLGIGRLLFDGFPMLAGIARLVPFRFLLVTLFLLGAANSADYINHTKNFPRGPNVIWISADGVRPDRLGIFGRPGFASPNIDALATRGLLFDNAFTPSPRSTQALSSMMTGRWPQSIGVRRLWDELGQEETTIGEVLRDNGYVTGAFVALPGGSRGLDQGFTAFEALDDRHAKTITDRATTWIGDRSKRPFFAWVHYNDALMPYVPQPEPGGNVDGFHYTPTRGCVVFGHETPDSAGIQEAIQLYERELRAMDLEIGRLIQFLEKTDRLHETLVIFAGTSGESFGEHHYWFDHGEFVYDSSVRVPMIISAANLPVGIRSTQVRLVDLFPTLLDILHYELSPSLDGETLLPIIERPEQSRDFQVFLESGESLTPAFNDRRPVPTIGGKIRALRDGRWKLIVTPGVSGSSNELYDLAADPSESENVAAMYPGEVKRLKAILDSWVQIDTTGTNEKAGAIPDWVHARH